MTYGDYFLSLCTADLTLQTLLPGGVRLFEDSGREGLNRIEVQQAFIQETGALQLNALIYEGEQMPTGEANSPQTGYQSTVTGLGIWLYDEGDNGYGTLQQAVDRMRAITNFQRIPDGFQFMWGRVTKSRREKLLNNACYLQCSVKAYGYWTS